MKLIEAPWFSSPIFAGYASTFDSHWVGHSATSQRWETAQAPRRPVQLTTSKGNEVLAILDETGLGGTSSHPWNPVIHELDQVGASVRLWLLHPLALSWNILRKWIFDAKPAEGMRLSQDLENAWRHALQNECKGRKKQTWRKWRNGLEELETFFTSFMMLQLSTATRKSQIPSSISCGLNFHIHPHPFFGYYSFQQSCKGHSGWSQLHKSHALQPDFSSLRICLHQVASKLWWKHSNLCMEATGHHPYFDSPKALAWRLWQSIMLVNDTTFLSTSLHLSDIWSFNPLEIVAFPGHRKYVLANDFWRYKTTSPECSSRGGAMWLRTMSWKGKSCTLYPSMCWDLLMWSSLCSQLQVLQSSLLKYNSTTNTKNPAPVDRLSCFLSILYRITGPPGSSV